MTDYIIRLARSGAYLAACSDIGFNQKTQTDQLGPEPLFCDQLMTLTH